jgi:hypothetical protein
MMWSCTRWNRPIGVPNAVLIEVPNPRHPFGARGVGEVPIVPPMAAVANASAEATGLRLRDLPMSPGNCVQRSTSGTRHGWLRGNPHFAGYGTHQSAASLPLMT